MSFQPKSVPLVINECICIEQKQSSSKYSAHQLTNGIDGFKKLGRVALEAPNFNNWLSLAKYFDYECRTVLSG